MFSGSQVAFRPRMIFAYVDSVHAAQCGRYFRRHGWEVHLIGNGSKLPRFIEDISPSALVIDTELIENGDSPATQDWLRGQGPLRVVLLTPKHTRETSARDTVMGAAVISRDEPVERLATVLCGQPAKL